MFDGLLQWRSKKIASRMIAGFGVLVLAAAVTGCSTGTSEAPSGDSGVETGDAPATIKLGVGASNTLFAAPYLAETLGYFDDENLNVEFTDATGANTANLVAAGEVDLTFWTFPPGMIIAQQGKQTSLLYATAGVSTSCDLIGGSHVNEIDDLKGKRIASLAVGTTTYGCAVYYNEKFGLDAEIVVFPDNASIQAAVGSGQVDGATGVHAILAPLVADGKAVMFIDATDPAQLAEHIGTDYPIGGFWALRDTVQEKREVMVRFFKAIDRAFEFMKTEDPTVVAQEIRKSAVYQSIPEEQLAGLLAIDAPLQAPANGIIDERTWDTMLDRMSEWGLDGFDPSSPALEYGEIVDMSVVNDSREG